MVFYLKCVEHLSKTLIAQMCRQPKFLFGESETFKQVTGTLANSVDCVEVHYTSISSVSALFAKLKTVFRI